MVAVAFTLVLWLSALVARGGGAVGGPLGTLAACLALHSLVRLALGPFAVALRIKGGERFVAAVYVASARASLGGLSAPPPLLCAPCDIGHSQCFVTFPASALRLMQEPETFPVSAFTLMREPETFPASASRLMPEPETSLHVHAG